MKKLKKDGTPKLSGGVKYGAGRKKLNPNIKKVQIYTMVARKNAKKAKEIIDLIAKSF